LEGGLAQIEKAIELNPLSPIVVVSRSNCLSALGRGQDALDLLESAERLDSSNSLILTTEAVLLMHFGKTTEAAACLERAIEINPEDIGALDVRGHYEQFIGNYQKARECWERAIKKGRGEGAEGMVGFATDFASLYWAIGDKRKAMDYVEQLRALPEETRDQQSFKLSMLGYAYAAVGNADEFFDILSSMIEAKQSIAFETLRGLRWIFPASNQFQDDPRWSAVFKRAGLEP
jgi:tetratricopeptide (TPR) repeat protein